MQAPIQHCWNEIGVRGDSSCPQLKTVIHCRNCSVYAAAGRTLLQREAPQGYIEEWTEILSHEWSQQHLITSTTESSLQKRESLTPETLSLIIFRLAQEWLALPVWTIKEITQPSPIHTLPHRSNEVFLGIVNIRGEILMCISLRELLGLPAINFQREHQLTPKSTPKSYTDSTPVIYKRSIVLEIQGNRWVFPVDEVSGVQRFLASDLQDAPVTLSRTPDTYTKKIFDWNDKKVNYIDSELLFYELLFYTLNRS